MPAVSTTIIRHHKERLSKCSLQPLVGHPQIDFLKESRALQFDATGYILLRVDAPSLSEADAGKPVLLLDSTWRLLPDLERCVVGEPVARSLPGVKTAYPRVSKISEDPLGGLASVEALYLAWLCLGVDAPELLDDYYWKEAFLENVEAYFRDEGLPPAGT